MDVDIGPSSPAMGFAHSGFPQVFQTPRVQLPATPTAATIPAPSTVRHLSRYPHPSSSCNSDVSYSNHEIPQNQPNLDAGGGTRKMRKRKAESQENERLSKRLSLLNLGTFYVLPSLHSTTTPSSTMRQFERSTSLTYCFSFS